MTKGRAFILIHGCGACIVLSLALFGCKGGKGGIVARVGNETITAEELDKELKNLPAPFHPQFQNPQAKKQFLENMILQRLLTQEAERRGLDKDPDVDRQVKAYRMNLLRQRLIQQIQTESPQPTDEEIKEFYAGHQSEFQTPERVRASHILVKTEAEAKKVMKELKRPGVTFTDAARKYSADQATKDRGGDIGYFTAGQPSLLSTVALSLGTIGDLSGPVQTPEGYHILLLTEKQPAVTRDLDSSREQIRQRFIAERRGGANTKFIEDLKKKSRVIVYDEALGTTSAPAPGPQPQMPPGHPPMMPPGHAPMPAPPQQGK